jgi:biopolymer transport protein ExbB
MQNTVMKTLVLSAFVILMLGGGTYLVPFAHYQDNLFIFSAYAQAPAATAPAATVETEEPLKAPETLADYFRMAGLTKWALLASAVWITALIIELILRGRVRALCPSFIVAQLSSTLAVKDYVKAWQFCVDNPSPLSRTMAPAIERIPEGIDKVMDAATDYLNFQNNIFKTKCSYLNLNATVNTLLGLFGTIFGMIHAFNKMAYSGATGDPAKLAGSIGEALICTLTGLGLAIFSLYLFYVFTNATKVAMTGMQRIVESLIGQIDFESVTPGVEIITAEMKARAMAERGKGGIVVSAPLAAAPVAGAPKATETVACPHCQHQVQVGAAKCPNCKTDLEWE